MDGITNDTVKDTTDGRASALVGSWRRAERTTCAATYPALLELRRDGQYRGTTDPPGEFATWDVGTWELDGDTLAMSTANDAIVRYRFTLTADVLRFTDPAGCTFAFRRGA